MGSRPGDLMPLLTAGLCDWADLSSSSLTEASLLTTSQAGLHTDRVISERS